MPRVARSALALGSGIQPPWGKEACCFQHAVRFPRPLELAESDGTSAILIQKSPNVGSSQLQGSQQIDSAPQP